MKRLILKITAIVMLLTLSLSLVGCGIFSSNKNNGGENLPTSSEMLGKVDYGTYEGVRVSASQTQDVVTKVKGSIITLACEKDGKIVSSGSGVIVDMRKLDDNNNVVDSANTFYILTCFHVISDYEDYDNLFAYLPDAENDNLGESDYNSNDYVFSGRIGKQIYNDALTLVGGDKISDIAVLRLTIQNQTVANGVTKVKFPASDYQMMQGESVIAIGNPAGDNPQTVSTGIISYINRETKTEIGDMTLTQIDANIYHGSSGGGLFNLNGELIGITNAGRGVQQGSNGSLSCYNGINFAIPYLIDANNGDSDNGFVNIACQLLATKTSQNYGYITGRKDLFGFSPAQRTSYNGITSVEISSVTLGSEAYRQGLRAGDVIKKAVKGDKTQLAGAEDITTIAQIENIINSINAKDQLSLVITRPGYNTSENYEITMTAYQYIFCDTGNYN